MYLKCFMCSALSPFFLDLFCPLPLRVTPEILVIIFINWQLTGAHYWAMGTGLPEINILKTKSPNWKEEHDQSLTRIRPEAVSENQVAPSIYFLMQSLLPGA